MRFDQNEKKFTYKVLFVALEKTQDFLPFLQTLSPFSRLLPGLENYWENFKTFSRIQDCVKPVHHSNMPPVVKKNLTPFMQSLPWLCQKRTRESKILLKRIINKG